MSNAATKPKARKREPVGMRYVTGRGGTRGLVPATKSDAERLDKSRLKEHDLVFVDVRKPRNPEFHRLAHRIGMLVVQNVPGFEHLTAHEVLKRLQLESGVACEPIAIRVEAVASRLVNWIDAQLGPGAAKIFRLFFAESEDKTLVVDIPISFSYASMAQGEFHEAVKGLCQYLHAKYLPNLSPAQIAEMAESMVDD